MRYLKWILPLTLLYIALTANPEPLNWLLGALLAVGVTLLMRPDPTPLRWSRLPAALLASGRFLLTLLWDLGVSSVQVARLVLRRKILLRQGVLALPTGSQADTLTVLSAQAITLTPGELVMEIEESGVMYTHCLDVVSASETEPVAQQERRQALERILR